MEFWQILVLAVVQGVGEFLPISSSGHVVILAFISLIFIFGQAYSEPVAWATSPVAVGFALFVHFLELLVATVQAYIFTMLTATFIGMSAHPAH